MKVPIAFTYLSLAIAAPVLAAPSVTIVEPANGQIDFGDVLTARKPSALHRILIRNTGDVSVSLAAEPLFNYLLQAPFFMNLSPGEEDFFEIKCSRLFSDDGISASLVLTASAQQVPFPVPSIPLHCRGGLFHSPDGYHALMPLTTVADNISRKTVAITNREPFPVTITGFQTWPFFTASLATGSLPRTVAPGESIDLALTFDPRGGTQEQRFDVMSEEGPVATFEHTGVSRLEIAPRSFAFGAVPEGATYTQTVTIRNASTAARTIATATSSLAEYQLSSLVGQVLAPGAELDATLTLHATTRGNRRTDLAIAFDTGDGFMTRAEAGVVAALFKLLTQDAAPNDGRLDYGLVDINTAPIDRTFTLTNTGITAFTVKWCSQPDPPFSLITPCPTSTPVPPGGSTTLTMRLTPGAVAGRINSYGSISIDRGGVGTMILLHGDVRLVDPAAPPPPVGPGEEEGEGEPDPLEGGAPDPTAPSTADPSGGGCSASNRTAGAWMLLALALGLARRRRALRR